MVTWRVWGSRIERMVGDAAVVEYTHPVADAVATLESVLAECAGTPLWSLPVKDVDDLVGRAHALLARVTGTLLLPLVAEADRRGICTEFDAGCTASWLQYLLRMPRAQVRRLVDLARAVDEDGGELAATGQALAEGRVSVEHAQVIAGAVADL